MEDTILFIVVVTVFPLIFGPIIFLSSSFLPIISLVLGLGTIRGKGSLWGLLISFVLSFTFFRLCMSLFVKIADISFETFQYGGIFFLTLFGLMMIFPKYSLWNHMDTGFKKGAVYGALLGFVWSFWVGLFKDVPSDYYEPKWIGPVEIYMAFVSSIVPGIILMAVSYFLSKFYPLKYLGKIEKVLGCLTLLMGVILAFHGITISPREGLKPYEPPPVQLHEIFHLPKFDKNSD